MVVQTIWWIFQSDIGNFSRYSFGITFFLSFARHVSGSYDGATETGQQRQEETRQEGADRIQQRRASRPQRRPGQRQTRGGDDDGDCEQTGATGLVQHGPGQLAEHAQGSGPEAQQVESDRRSGTRQEPGPKRNGSDGGGGIGGFGAGGAEPGRGRDTEGRQRVHGRRVPAPERQRTKSEVGRRQRLLGGETQKPQESGQAAAAGQQQGSAAASGRGQFVGRGPRGRRGAQGETENAEKGL